MKYVQRKFKNMIPISHFLNEFYSNCNTLLLPPLVDISDAKWNYFKTIDLAEVNHFEGIRIIFAGTPAKKDLLENLIQAMLQVLKDCNRIQLLVAGVSNNQALQYCTKSDLSKFKNNIIFLGRVPQAFVPSLYHISDFSAIIREPSRKNTAGFPTKMAESMAAGCPVLLNRTGDLGNFAVDGTNSIYIEDFHIESIKKGLLQILAMTKEQINIMKQAARKTGELKFYYRQYLREGEQFLKNLR